MFNVQYGLGNVQCLPLDDVAPESKCSTCTVQCSVQCVICDVQCSVHFQMYNAPCAASSVQCVRSDLNDVEARSESWHCSLLRVPLEADSSTARELQ